MLFLASNQSTINQDFIVFRMASLFCFGLFKFLLEIFNTFAIVKIKTIDIYIELTTYHLTSFIS